MAYFNSDEKLKVQEHLNARDRLNQSDRSSKHEPHKKNGVLSVPCKNKKFYLYHRTRDAKAKI